MPLYDSLPLDVRKKVNRCPAFAAAIRYHQNDKGEDMEFRNQSYLLQIYVEINKASCHRMVVEKSVQCGLSELFIINSHVEANSGLSVMYIFPKYALRDRFVQSRVKRLYNRNAFYRNKKQMARKLEGANRLSLSAFGKGIINFVGSNVADEFFEFPADSVYIDEKDLCDQENLKLVPGRMDHSKYKFQREISNPSVDNEGIDKRYQSSTKGKWMIKCEHCNHRFTPDMFVHLVEETGPDEYRILDPDYVPKKVSPSLICDKCERKVDRLQKGVWEHEFEDREYRGFRISQLFSPRTDLGDLLDEDDSGFFEAIKSARGKQIFHNMRLGLPYSDSDAKITEDSLNQCQSAFAYPYVSVHYRSVFIGVDVGKLLNVVVRERLTVEGEVTYRLCEACTVPSFGELAKLLNKYQHRICVIDALPEGHSVEELKKEYQKVWSCLFVETALAPTINKEKRELKINRTTIIDSVKRTVDLTQLMLPEDTKNRIPTYYSHLTALTRVFQVDDIHPDRSHFVWVGSMPDHYLFAEVYCQMASRLAPHNDIFDAYENQNREMRKPKEEAGFVELTTEQKRSPAQFLQDMNRRQIEELQKEYGDMHKKS